MGPRNSVITTANGCVSRPLAANFFRNCGAVSAFNTLVFNVLVVSTLGGGNVARRGTAAGCLATTNYVTTLKLTFICISLFCLNTASDAMTPNTTGNNTVLATCARTLFKSSNRVMLSVVMLVTYLAATVNLVSTYTSCFDSVYGIACGT